MIIKSENINELLDIGFEPETLILQADGSYYIEESEFRAFAEDMDYEEGLDFSIDGDNLSINIVLDEADDDGCDGCCGGCCCSEDDAEDDIENLSEYVKDELDIIKGNVSSARYIGVQMGLIKDILLG